MAQTIRPTKSHALQVIILRALTSPRCTNLADSFRSTFRQPNFSKCPQIPLQCCVLPFPPAHLLIVTTIAVSLLNLSHPWQLSNHFPQVRFTITCSFSSRKTSDVVVRERRQGTHSVSQIMTELNYITWGRSISLVAQQPISSTHFHAGLHLGSHLG